MKKERKQERNKREEVESRRGLPSEQLYFFIVENKIPRRIQYVEKTCLVLVERKRREEGTVSLRIAIRKRDGGEKRRLETNDVRDDLVGNELAVLR